MTIHPESVGGTPAARMIHRESNQLLIGPYLIDPAGRVRVIPPAHMPGRLTAIARHLKDPAKMVYYFDMEGMLYEANVHTLEVRKLFQKPVPGWHGKGGYTSQGRLVVANNGEREKFGDPADLQVEDMPPHPENAGCLAQWDGQRWELIERRQFTDVTGPGGIHGAPDDTTPLWAIGWDRRSLRLKVLDERSWHTYLLPKAAHNNDARHGWYTEWPRIREVGGGRFLMDMHGMFFDFPKNFRAANTAGITPIGSHLRYIPDFCDWNGQLVLGSDETSIQGNPMAGQPQSNLWFGQYEELQQWGPASGWGGPWVDDSVKANQPSDPFLLNGFARRALHLAVGRGRDWGARSNAGGNRCSDQFQFETLPPALANLARVTIDRGDYHQPAPGYSFTVNQPVTVYLAVDARGAPAVGDDWARTDMVLTWGTSYQDLVFAKSFQAGIVHVPGNTTAHKSDAFGLPHTAFVAARSDKPAKLRIASLTPGLGGKIAPPAAPDPGAGQPPAAEPATPVSFRLEIDSHGDGQWREYTRLVAADGQYVYHIFPADLEAQWIRLTADRDCVATAYFHLTDSQYAEDRGLFAGLADVSEESSHAALLYPAKRNRDLRVIALADEGDRYFDFTQSGFQFRPADADLDLREHLKVEPRFSVDDASVILVTSDGRLRLPKGDSAYDAPFRSGWPRWDRELESERHLANIHGTFYEVPLETNSRPPVFRKLRPVASHRKRIADYCTWSGLLVLSGVRTGAESDGHVFASAKGTEALWFGGIDDLWKLGKPVGRGGPWKNASVRAGEPSDAYLMTGYDKKTLELTADRDATIRIEVDFDHQTGWHLYESVRLPADRKVTHVFPEGFSAHWVRLTADTDCVATADFVYQ
ncbi:MAG: hypothetical protein FJ276_29685 [Planctomycetes bacterium]|nr:hypothetical protein [Planctomycetota bacterium]